jgi:sodium/potassium/calcium exchanger 2
MLCLLYFSLPIPWLLYWAAFQDPINVDSSGMACSIVLLFLMLLAVIMAIAISKWKMNHALGFSMLLFYVIFLVLSILLSLDIIVCPVEI